MNRCSFFRFVRLGGLLLMPFMARAQDCAVVINEIHYHSAGGNAAMEFIELHNQHSIDIDISGWRLAGPADFLIPEGTIILANGYLTIAANPATLMAATGAAGVLGPWTGALPDDGGRVRLYNPKFGNGLTRMWFGRLGQTGNRLTHTVLPHSSCG